MRQAFESEDLKRELERSLGFALRPLERLGGSVALNFKAVRTSDGLTFAVKCLPKAKRKNYDRIVEHLDVLSEVNGVRRIFERECVPSFADFDVLCLSWCEGEHLFPDKLTDGEFETFLADYLKFSNAMQKVKTLSEARPIAEWRRSLLAKCSGPAAGIFRRAVERLTRDGCEYTPEAVRVTHGDFHHGNFLFSAGRVRAFLDLEELRPGYPAEDLVRYFTCAAEHLRWYEQTRKRRMLRMFDYAVRHLPYSQHEWITAVNARFIVKAYKQLRKSERLGLGKGINLLWCHRFYCDMRKIVERAFAVQKVL